jgi:hypothetical protein
MAEDWAIAEAWCLVRSEEWKALGPLTTHSSFGWTAEAIAVALRSAYERGQQELIELVKTWERRFREEEQSADDAEAELVVLRRRIHQIERHNQFFERCESAWCNPVAGNDPAAGIIGAAWRTPADYEAQLAKFRAAAEPFVRYTGEMGGVIDECPVRCDSSALVASLTVGDLRVLAEAVKETP